MIKRGLTLLGRIVLFLLQAALIVAVTLVLAGAFSARQRPDLDSWHTTTLASEFRAGQGVQNLQSYLELENRVFKELDSSIVSRIKTERGDELNRFARNSRSFPERGDRNWNRTQVLQPDTVRGGILMLHGMTDSPYSMRHFAGLFLEQGYYVLNMRMPGHGTIPAELARVDWRDWQAAVRIGAADVASKLSPGQPFYIMGYSNGGSLAVQYALDSLEDTALRVPDRLFLLSPMMGVSSMARFGKIYYWLGQLRFFHKSLWMDVLPEYDPHKYNSFPMNAPRQSLALTEAVNAQIQRLARSGALNIMPPVLTFQSLVDSTIITRQVMTRLYDRLPANSSELVLFDVNRAGVLEDFVAPQHDALLTLVSRPVPRDYTLTVISNQEKRDLEVMSLSRKPHSTETSKHKLGLSWPRTIYSLSHVALPFPPDDEVYGFEAGTFENNFPRLGRAQMTGESGALILPASLFARARSNPFHDYVENRILEVIEQD